MNELERMRQKEKQLAELKKKQFLDLENEMKEKAKLKIKRMFDSNDHSQFVETSRQRMVNTFA